MSKGTAAESVTMLALTAVTAYTLPAQPNTRPNRIDFFIARINSELGSEAWLSGNSLDFDRSVVDLGDIDRNKRIRPSAALLSATLDVPEVVTER